MTEELDQFVAEIAAEHDRTLDAVYSVLRALHGLTVEVRDLRNALRVSNGEAPLPPLPPLAPLPPLLPPPCRRDLN
jgi:hypothetical protein